MRLMIWNDSANDESRSLPAQLPPLVIGDSKICLYQRSPDIYMAGAERWKQRLLLEKNPVALKDEWWTRETYRKLLQ